MMPILFSLGIHDVLAEVNSTLNDDEFIFAYLDDIYIVAKPERIREIYDVLAHALLDNANISINAGKTKVWNRIGRYPDNVDDLGTEVWSPDGIIILGTPIGSTDFVHLHAQGRIDEERKLWDMLPTVPDLQCA